MPSKTAVKSKTKQAPAKKPRRKRKRNHARQARAVKPAGTAGCVTPCEGAAAAKTAKPATGKPATGKAPVSNVEAIKAVAIKAAAKGAVPAPAAPTRRPRDLRQPVARPFRMPPSADDQRTPEARLRDYERSTACSPRGSHLRQIEDVLAMLNDMGINVVESEETEAEEGERRTTTMRRWRSRRVLAESVTETPKKSDRASAPTIRCACICARWARGAALARGEIAIAKRIRGRPRGR